MKKALRSPLLPLAALALVVALLAAGASADNIDPFSNGSKFAWGENTGWLNAKPANCTACGVMVNPTNLTGYIWGENIGWVNLNCQNNSTCAGPAGNWGVTKDGTGNLAGYAWGENVGWISFSCTNKGTCGSMGNYGVHINTASGFFSGYAWGENIGWISFSCSNTGTCGSTGNYKVQTTCSPPWTVAANDVDCDSFSATLEGHVGTDPNAACGTNAWPVDINNDHFSDITDLSALTGNFSKAVPPAPVRQDIGPEPSGDGFVDITDIAKMASFFAKGCTP